MMRCAGKVIGVHSQRSAAAIKKPGLAGRKIREHCGYVLDEVIALVPEDGAEHVCECPQCGNKFSVRRTPAEAKAETESPPAE